MRTLSCFVLLLAFVPIAHAGVLTVGGAGANFNDVQSAINAAVDGDVILVRASVMSMSVSGKSLSILADQASNLTLNGDVVITGVPAGGLVLLAGFDLVATPSSSVEVFDCIGAVRLQDDSMSTTNNFAGGALSALDIHNCGDVAVTNCNIRGADGANYGPGNIYDGAIAAYVQDSTVSFHGCTVHGGRGANGGFSQMLVPTAGGFGSDGVFAIGTSNVFLSGCTVIGGDGGTGGNGGGPPPMCAPTAYNYPTAGGFGGYGVRLVTSATGAGFGDNCVGGMGGMSGVNQCGSQPSQSPNGSAFHSDGQPFSETAGIARILNAPRVVRESTSFHLHFAGVPGDHVYLAGSQHPAHLSALQLDGVFLGQGPYRRTSMGMIGSTGTLDVTLPLGDLGPGVAEDVRHLQCVVLDVGGHVHVGSSSVLTRLDSAY